MMPVTQTERAARFVALHARPGAFVIPNPWDAGTARILEGLGFEALTTTSAGLAFALGRARRRRRGDARARRSPTPGPSSTRRTCPWPPISRMASATRPKRRPKPSVWRAKRPASWAGRSKMRPAIPSGRSTTSSTPSSVWRPPQRPRVRLPFPFVLVGRAENFLHGRPDLDDTIRRLQAFEHAGADALYAPGLTRPEDIRTVCGAVSEARQRGHGAQGRVPFRGRARGVGRAAHQRGVGVEPRGAGCLSAGGAGRSGSTGPSALRTMPCRTWRPMSAWPAARVRREKGTQPEVGGWKRGESGSATIQGKPTSSFPFGFTRTPAGAGGS